MTVEQYFTHIGYDYNTSKEFFFVQLKPAPTSNESSYNSYKEYWSRTTPCRTVSDWWECDEIMNSYVVNIRGYSADWVTGAEWNNYVNSGRWGSLIIITKEDLEWKYGEKQGMDMINYIDGKILERVGEPKPLPQYDKPRRVYTRDSRRMLDIIRHNLVFDGSVVVVSKYYTSNGVVFDGWLRQGLKDIPCDIKVTDHNPVEGYPSEYLVTFTGDFDETVGGAPHPKH